MSAAATVTSLIVRRKERHPEVTKMSLPESITTCLSPAVHYMVCKLGFEIKENYDINNFVSKRGEVSWRTISERVCYLESDQSIDYVKSVQLLGPVCESVHLHLRSLTTEQFEVQYALWFQWTNATELFLEVFGVLECMQVTAIALSLMKLTSCLERALGDVFLLIGKDCPFLLRDLLASQELAGVFGRSVMNVLRVFIGSPRGLNLRNILWHGFASPQEIPVKYCSMLLFLTAGLGQLLKRYLVQNKLSLVHRPYITFSNLEELDIFPDINYEVLSLTEELAKRSSFVLKIMLPFWISALTAFRQHRYADCITLLLPQLETGLRLLFTTVNKCPSRLLTAEPSSLYTTLDEMLAKQLTDEEINQLPLILGEPAVEFLWDFLNHQEGPRVRDHLSHGEINLNEFPREIANQILGFAIILLCKFSEEEEFVTLKEHAAIKPLITCANCYSSRFHPIARLKKQLISLETSLRTSLNLVLECMKSISSWSELPVVSEEQIQAITGHERCTEMQELVSLITGILSQLQHHLPPSCYILDDPLNNLLTEELLTELCGMQIRTLYCPRLLLEVLVVLRQIGTQCHQVSEQVIVCTEMRYKQWVNKTLHSRQRHNYLRMLKSVKFLSPVLRLILVLITLELNNIHAICQENPFEYQQYLKFLKSILQYTENLVTYTSPEKNKWDETGQLTYRALIKMKTFNARKLTLMQLATQKKMS
ncbi:endoplasmic reticulum membrane-associated RNA degradation protein isoform X1 [Alligator sinensis]|uniref:Endoplasmic reticulum membrane-associated RNA degradation protein isoform X1 n=1 Tax=Alligator sinensis TaxID=38654 RepID=A0A3Q0FY64_ALLSI|nr:endoplasmic reticulum membrane-associated RNA degradation protein isoform X1 [Alligator sinensis]